MSKFNQTPTIKTVNKEGHVAYSMGDKECLVTQVLTTFFNESKYYGDNSDEIKDTIARVAQDDPGFIAKLAIFARREFNLRSISHVLTAILAHEVKGKPFIRDLIPKVIMRVDDITEILSAYLKFYGKPIPNSLKKGINDTIGRFDEYALAKYRGSTKDLKLRDVLRITHPKPRNNAQTKLWEKLIADNLEIPYTWETELSAKGNTKEVWEELIASGKVGYMALLRNLRNIINAGPDNIDTVYKTLQNKANVRTSKQLPFRFLSAYKELEKVSKATSKVFNVLETALEHSVDNLPNMTGKTAIVVDVSGSMDSTISDRSKITCAEIGLLLGVIASKFCDDSIFITFDTKIYRPVFSSRGGMLQAVRSIDVCGGGTYMQLPFEYLIEHKIKVDRIIMVSDNQVNVSNGKTVQSMATKYRYYINPDLWLHAIDLQGYGTQQFAHGGKTNIMAGWSERLFDFIYIAEEGISNLVKTIERYGG